MSLPFTYNKFLPIWIRNTNAVSGGTYNGSVSVKCDGKSEFVQDAVFDAKVAVGKAPSAYPLDVAGNVNITGQYHINGVPFVADFNNPTFTGNVSVNDSAYTSTKNINLFGDTLYYNYPLDKGVVRMGNGEFEIDFATHEAYINSSLLQIPYADVYIGTGSLTVDCDCSFNNTGVQFNNSLVQFNGSTGFIIRGGTTELGVETIGDDNPTNISFAIDTNFNVKGGITSFLPYTTGNTLLEINSITNQLFFRESLPEFTGTTPATLLNTHLITAPIIRDASNTWTNQNTFTDPTIFTDSCTFKNTVVQFNGSNGFIIRGGTTELGVEAVGDENPTNISFAIDSTFNIRGGLTSFLPYTSGSTLLEINSTTNEVYFREALPIFSGTLPATVLSTNLITKGYADATYTGGGGTLGTNNIWTGLNSWTQDASFGAQIYRALKSKLNSVQTLVASTTPYTWAFGNADTIVFTGNVGPQPFNLPLPTTASLGTVVNIVKIGVHQMIVNAPAGTTILNETNQAVSTLTQFTNVRVFSYVAVATTGSVWATSYSQNPNFLLSATLSNSQTFSSGTKTFDTAVILNATRTFTNNGTILNNNVLSFGTAGTILANGLTITDEELSFISGLTAPVQTELNNLTTTTSGLSTDVATLEVQATRLTYDAPTLLTTIGDNFKALNINTLGTNTTTIANSASTVYIDAETIYTHNNTRKMGAFNSYSAAGQTITLTYPLMSCINITGTGTITFNLPVIQDAIQGHIITFTKLTRDSTITFNRSSTNVIRPYKSNSTTTTTITISGLTTQYAFMGATNAWTVINPDTTGNPLDFIISGGFNPYAVYGTITTTGNLPTLASGYYAGQYLLGPTANITITLPDSQSAELAEGMEIKFRRVGGTTTTVITFERGGTTDTIMQNGSITKVSSSTFFGSGIYTMKLMLASRTAGSAYWVISAN